MRFQITDKRRRGWHVEIAYGVVRDVEQSDAVVASRVADGGNILPVRRQAQAGAALDEEDAIERERGIVQNERFALQHLVGEIGGGAIRCVVCHDGGQIIRLDNGEALEIAHRLEGIIRCIPRGEILDGQAQRRDGVGGDALRADGRECHLQGVADDGQRSQESHRHRGQRKIGHVERVCRRAGPVNEDVISRAAGAEQIQLRRASGVSSEHATGNAHQVGRRAQLHFDGRVARQRQSTFQGERAHAAASRQRAAAGHRDQARDGATARETLAIVDGERRQRAYVEESIRSEIDRARAGQTAASDEFQRAGVHERAARECVRAAERNCAAAIL